MCCYSINEVISMAKETCSDCTYFRQHYTFDQKRIFRVYCGHCTFLSPKKKHPDTRACPNYSAAPANREVFATKEYLTKELIQYVINLDLLPEIQDDPKHIPTKRD